MWKCTSNKLEQTCPGMFVAAQGLGRKSRITSDLIIFLDLELDFKSHCPHSTRLSSYNEILDFGERNQATNRGLVVHGDGVK